MSGSLINRKFNMLFFRVDIFKNFTVTNNIFKQCELNILDPYIHD